MTPTLFILLGFFPGLCIGLAVALALSSRQRPVQDAQAPKATTAPYREIAPYENYVEDAGKIARDAESDQFAREFIQEYGDEFLLQREVDEVR